jgi:hypothetical protein
MTFPAKYTEKTKDKKREICMSLDWSMSKLEYELFKIVYVLTGKELEKK